MKKLFIVASVYQLFNSFNLLRNNNVSVDLVLMKTRGNFVDTVNINDLKKFFDNVYICEFEVKKKKIENLLLVVKNTYGKKTFGSLIPEKYDQIFLAGTETRSKTVAMKLLKRDGSIYYYEDGLESYCSVLNPEVKKKKDFIFKLMYGSYPLQKCKRMYVYEPDVVAENPTGVICARISKIERNNSDFENFKKVFNQKPFRFDKKVIFLNAWFEDERAYLLQDETIKILMDFFGKENISVKVHPNELKTIKRIPDVEYIDSKCCFEVANFYQDWSEKIFVTMESTAAVTPYMIYGDTPNIIYLNRIFQEQFPEYGDVYETIELIKAIYPDKTKVMTPNTMKEFKELVANLAKNKVCKCI